MEYHVQEHLHYAGLATWNHCECTQDIEGADIVLLGVPFDAGTTFRPGARFGPCGVRDQSLIACCFKYPWEYELKKEAKVIDYGDDERKAAHDLFADLRELDRQGYDIIYIRTLEESGLGFSVMNRMLKSAGYDVVK